MYLLLIVIIIVYLWWALHEVICEDLIDRQFSKKDCINHSFFPLCIFYFFCIPICHCVFVFVLYSAKVWLMRCCVGNLGPFSLGSEFVSIINVVFFFNYAFFIWRAFKLHSVYIVCKEEGAKFTRWFGQRYKEAPFSFWFEFIPILNTVDVCNNTFDLVFPLSRNVNFQFVVEVWQCSLCSLC